MYATACHIRLSGTDCSHDSKPTCSLLTPFCTCALLPLAHFLHRTCGARLIGASCCSALAPLCICLHVLPASKRRHNRTQNPAAVFSAPLGDRVGTHSLPIFKLCEPRLSSGCLHFACAHEFLRWDKPLQRQFCLTHATLAFHVLSLGLPPRLSVPPCIEPDAMICWATFCSSTLPGCCIL